MIEAESHHENAVDISFDDNILMVNQSYLELQDSTGAMFAQYIRFARVKIDSLLYNSDGLRRDREGQGLYTHVLLGRLSLMTSEANALTNAGLKVFEPADIFKEHLYKDFYEFWDAIIKSGYIPNVQRRVVSRDSKKEGTWLSASRQ